MGAVTGEYTPRAIFLNLNFNLSFLYIESYKNCLPPQVVTEQIEARGKILKGERKKN